MPYFKIDEAVKHVKIIADNNRCSTCDKLFGVRLRYSCGHIICGECVEDAKECLICIDSSKNSNPQVDKLKEQQVQNVSNLLTTFQDTFNIDVYKRYRLSEKLKIEDHIFPKPIPVSVTYFNKRRSSQSSTKENEESVFYIDGEEISKLDSTMNARVNIVQKWFDANEKSDALQRKPFSDINLNKPHTRTREKNRRGSKLSNRKNYEKKKSMTLNVSNTKSMKQCKTSKELGLKNENKSQSEILHRESFKISDSCNKGKNESNENLNTIVIDATLSPVVDKDKQAWLAVLKAHDSEKKVNNSTTVQNSSKTSCNKCRKNVCFYKKYFLFKSCYFCLNNLRGKNSYFITQRLTCNDVSILIKSNSIVTSTSVKNHENDDKILSKHTVEVQTDEKSINVDKNLLDTFVSSAQRNLDYFSQENVKQITTIAKKSDEYHNEDTHKGADVQCLVINDSDSDIEINSSGPIKVIADVHRPSNRDYGILSLVEDNIYESRLRQSRLRRTVDSNNSSEKENVEPNRAKKLRLNKKQEMKK